MLAELRPLPGWGRTIRVVRRTEDDGSILPDRRASVCGVRRRSGEKQVLHNHHAEILPGELHGCQQRRGAMPARRGGVVRRPDDDELRLPARHSTACVQRRHVQRRSGEEQVLHNRNPENVPGELHGCQQPTLPRRGSMSFAGRALRSVMLRPPGDLHRPAAAPPHKTHARRRAGWGRGAALSPGVAPRGPDPRSSGVGPVYIARAMYEKGIFMHGRHIPGPPAADPGTGLASGGCRSTATTADSPPLAPQTSPLRPPTLASRRPPPPPPRPPRRRSCLADAELELVLLIAAEVGVAHEIELVHVLAWRGRGKVSRA